MGMTASVHLISPDAYACASNGDFDGFNAGCEGAIAADLDKAWHAIHYLVTGDHELRFLIGGVQIEPASETVEAHSPESVGALHNQLSATSLSAIMAKFDPEEFNAKDSISHRGTILRAITSKKT